MNKFIGNWKLKSWIAQQGNDITYPFGKNPSGYISYFADRLMIVVIMRDIKDIPTMFSTNDPLKATDQEKIISFQSYLSYWGSFNIDEKSQIITHKLEGCSFPHWIGTEQKRNFEFRDNLLLLSTKVESTQHVLTWEKRGAE